MNTRKILKNASYLFISDVLLRIITAAATILIARYLGAHAYGIISIALAFSAIAGFFTDIGLTQTLTREATKPNANLEILMSSFFRVRIILALITVIGSYITIEIMYSDAYVRSIVSWVVYPTIIGSALFGPGVAYFQVIEKMKITAIMRFFQGSFTALSLLLAFLFKWPVHFVAPIYGFSYVIVGILSMFLLIRELNFFRGWDREVVTGIYSFTINGLIVMILPQLGPLILEKVSSLKNVGFFSAAYRIPVLLYQVPGVIAVAFYPRLFAFGNSNQMKEHYNLTVFQLRMMSLFVFLVSFPFLVYSDWWIQLLFGKGWEPAANAAGILTLMVIFQAMERPMADHLTTKGLQNLRTIITFIGMLVAMICYYFLGKKYGVTGGAIAAVSTELSILLLLTMKIDRGWRLLFSGTFVNIISFLVTITITMLFGQKIHPIFGMIIGGITYLGIIILLDKEIRSKAIEFYKIRIMKVPSKG
jgi:O-antigen/teichoic acid export membrane protein